MDTHKDKQGAFQKVGECLYRYSSNGVYYARIKTSGKEIRQGLGTIDTDADPAYLARAMRRLSVASRSR